MLSQTLTEVRKRIAKQAKGLNETNTKSTLIDPVLRALGWDVENLEDVDHEFRLKSHDDPVDYALLVMREPKLFVEAKALGKDLDDHKWSKQIMSYAGVAGVEWIVLTDGNEWRIYNSHAPVPIEQKLLMKVRIADGTPLAAQMLGLIAKDQIHTSKIEALWRAHFVDRKVLMALEKLFEREDMVLLNHIRNGAKDLTADEVRGSLRRCSHKFEYPVMVDLPVPDDRPPPVVDPTPGTQLQVSLADLIAAGLIRPPLALAKRYLGKDLTAKVLAGGRVEFDGTPYTSLSIAGNVARASVAGPKPDGKKFATNGWEFWRYKDADGREREISVLREKYAKLPGAKSGRSAAGA